MSLDNTTYHIPVLLEEAIREMAIRPDGTYCDLTFGGGGHSRHILSQIGEKGQLYSFDQDRDTLQNAPDDERFHYVESNFRFLRGALRLRGVTEVDGDLGCIDDVKVNVLVCNLSLNVVWNSLKSLLSVPQTVEQQSTVFLDTSHNIIFAKV